jgi:hypothetical protein
MSLSKNVSKVVLGTAVAGGYANLSWEIAPAGILVSFVWYRGIKSYKGLNGGKFSVIHAIEEGLSIAPYTAEWLALGKGKDPKKYRSFSDIEMLVPFIFMAIHGLTLIYNLYPTLQKLIT